MGWAGVGLGRRKVCGVGEEERDVRGEDVTEEGVFVGDQRRLVRCLSLGVVAHCRFGRHCRYVMCRKHV